MNAQISCCTLLRRSNNLNNLQKNKNWNSSTNTLLHNSVAKQSVACINENWKRTELLHRFSQMQFSLITFHKMSTLLSHWTEISVMNIHCRAIQYLFFCYFTLVLSAIKTLVKSTTFFTFMILPS